MPLLEDVFKLNGVPTLTFVRPKEYSRLLVGLRTPGRGVIVEGPSGIGKSTAVTKVLEELGQPHRSVHPLSPRNQEDLEYIAILPQIDNAGIVLVDDFHRLPTNLQELLADFLKLIADSERTDTKLILVGINDANQRLIRYASDLQARVEVVRLENNPREKIIELVELGERELNITIAAKKELVEAARGSFYLAQMLAHEVCVQADLLETSKEHRTLLISPELAKTKLYNKLQDRFYRHARDFVRGVKFQSAGRAPYFHILKWLADSTEWSINLRTVLQDNQGYRGSVGQVMDKGFLAEFINEKFAHLLHYDQDSTTLSVEDPQFIFFIRECIWPELGLDAGFVNLDHAHTYDFALSFSGEERPFAKALAEELRAREFEVFYDHFEQSRILAEDVEEYLRPIYQTQAQYVIVLLSSSYPSRVWTVFESKQFNDRFKHGSVIAIKYDDVSLDPSGLVNRTGFIAFNANCEASTEVKRIVDLLQQKVKDAALQSGRLSPG